MGNCYCIRLNQRILAYIKTVDKVEKIIRLYIADSSYLTRADFSVELVYIPDAF